MLGVGPGRARVRRHDDGHRARHPAAPHGRGARRDHPPAQRRGGHPPVGLDDAATRPSCRCCRSTARMPIAVASTTSPAGMMCAGKHGVGVLSLGAGLIGGKKDLAAQWAMGQEAAAAAGQVLRREEWRLVIRAHLADSREEAMRRRARGPRARAPALLPARRRHEERHDAGAGDRGGHVARRYARRHDRRPRTAAGGHRRVRRVPGPGQRLGQPARPRCTATS